MSVQVRPVSSDDFFAWIELYAGYNTFYELELDDAKALRVWSWLMDAAHELRGLLAVDETNTPIGLAHYRGFVRPSSGTSGLYLDDLFVADEARGRGTATALIEAVRECAAGEGRTVVRWITAADNETAQRLYDRVAQRTDWVTYDLVP